MKFQVLKKIQKTALGFALVLASTSVVHAGGSHAGAAPWPFSKVQTVAGDAMNFHVVALKRTSIATSVKYVSDPECLQTAETPFVSCAHAVDGDFVPGYVVDVIYTSKETNMASDEYPQGPQWGTYFDFQDSEIDPSLIASLPTDGKARKEALNQIFQVVKTTSTYPTTQSANDPNCKWVEDDNTSADEVSGRYVPAGCENETAPAVGHTTTIQISVKQ